MIDYLLSFASSYIPTTSSTASRSADSLTFPWTATTATILAKVQNTNFNSSLNNFGESNQIVGSGADGRYGTLQIYNAGGLLGTNSSASTPLTTSAVSNWSASNIVGVSGTPSGRILTANGAAAVSDTSTLFNGTPSNLYLGSNDGLFGNMQQFGIWNVTATAAQLQILTS